MINRKQFEAIETFLKIQSETIKKVYDLENEINQEKQKMRVNLLQIYPKDEPEWFTISGITQSSSILYLYFSRIGMQKTVQLCFRFKKSKAPINSFDEAQSLLNHLQTLPVNELDYSEYREVYEFGSNLDFTGKGDYHGYFREDYLLEEILENKVHLLITKEEYVRMTELHFKYISA